MRARLEGLLSYESTRLVRVKNWRLGLVFLILQACIIAYVVVYSIIVNKGYQLYDVPVGTASLKIKGASWVDGTSREAGNFTVFDAVDLVVPALERDAAFVQTSYIPTYTQTASECVDDSSPAKCVTDADCVRDSTTFWGIKNGTCSDRGFCFIQGWCPLEAATGPASIPLNLVGIGKFTLQGKVRSYFPKFGVSVQQTILTQSASLPFLSISQIFETCGDKYTDSSEFVTLGAVILLSISYDCDLNKPASSCSASVDISRVDGSEAGTRGFNYRYFQYRGDELQYRDLFKVNGIRFVTIVGGRGGRFDFVTLLTNIGAGIGLLSVATLITDWAMKKCAKRRVLYTHSAVQEVRDDSDDPYLQQQQLKSVVRATIAGNSPNGSPVQSPPAASATPSGAVSIELSSGAALHASPSASGSAYGNGSAHGHDSPIASNAHRTSSANAPHRESVNNTTLSEVMDLHASAIPATPLSLFRTSTLMMPCGVHQMATGSATAAAAVVSLPPPRIVGVCPYMCPLSETKDRLQLQRDRQKQQQRTTSPAKQPAASPVKPNSAGSSVVDHYYLHALEVWTASQLSSCGCTHATGTNGSAPISMAGVKLLNANASAPATDDPSQLSLIPVTVYRRSTSHETVDFGDSAMNAAANASPARIRVTATADAKSAAVRTVSDPDIRGVSALALSVQHLTRCALQRTVTFDSNGTATASGDVPFSAVYAFVADRLRAVKKEMIITQTPTDPTTIADSIDWLERMIRFYILGTDLLINDALASAGGAGAFTFDATLNDRLIIDTLWTLLDTYRAARELLPHATPATASAPPATAASAADTKSAPAATAVATNCLQYAAQFNAYSLLLRLDERDMTELQPFLCGEYMNSPHTKRALALWTSYHTNNYESFFRLIRQIRTPHSSATAAAAACAPAAGLGFDRVAAAIVKRYVWTARARALKTMNQTYQPNSAYPIADLVRAFDFDSEAEASDFVVAHGLPILRPAAPTAGATAGPAVAVLSVKLKAEPFVEPSADTMQMYRLKQQIRMQTTAASTATATATAAASDSKANAQTATATVAAVTALHPIIDWLTGH